MLLFKNYKIMKLKISTKYFFVMVIVLFSLTTASQVHATTIFHAPSVNGLVGYWNFNDGSGTTAEDKSGQGNNGTLTNMDPATDWVDGKVGSGALDFDGSNDYVDAGSSSSLRFHTGDFTVTGWIKSDSLTGTRTLGTTYLDLNTGWLFGTSNSKLGYYTNAWKSANTTLVTGQWYHIGITVDASGNYIFYLNGNSDGSGALTLPANTTESFKIGAYGASGGLGRFDGLIDEVRIYNRALSADEISRLYNLKTNIVNRSQEDRITSGLVGMWSFDGNHMDWSQGTAEARDQSGNANHGDVINGALPIIGKIGQALDFDGSNDYVDAGDPLSGALDFGTGDFTISVWVKPESISNMEIINKALNSGTFEGYELRIADNLLFDFWPYNNGGNRVFSTTSPVVNTWYHIVGYRSNGTIGIAVNGVIQATALNSVDVNTTEPFRIGYNNTGWDGASWNGLIDEVRIYNRALSADEVTRLYNLGK